MFSRIFIERPRFAMVISIVLVLAGVISVFSLPISLYPEITPPEVVVSATYPGASAEVVAKTIGIPLEEEINGVEDMLYMSSSSENSSYQLTVTFKVGVDRDMAQVKVQNRIQQAQSKLPTEVTRQGLTVKSRSSNTLGFITIGSIFPGSWNWEIFWNLTAFLSVMLAVINILPIPALDGGHLLFTVYEMITGHRPSDKFLIAAQTVGMFLLLAIMILAFGNDIVRLFN